MNLDQRRVRVVTQRFVGNLGGSSLQDQEDTVHDTNWDLASPASYVAHPLSARLVFLLRFSERLGQHQRIAPILQRRHLVPGLHW